MSAYATALATYEVEHGMDEKQIGLMNGMLEKMSKCK
jgi:hypothetical protein